jgi:hypothetical protein
MMQPSTLVERMIDNDAETLALFRAATVGKKHVHADKADSSLRTIRPVRDTTRA